MAETMRGRQWEEREEEESEEEHWNLDSDDNADYDYDNFRLCKIDDDYDRDHETSDEDEGEVSSDGSWDTAHRLGKLCIRALRSTSRQTPDPVPNLLQLVRRHGIRNGGFL